MIMQTEDEIKKKFRSISEAIPTHTAGEYHLATGDLRYLFEAGYKFCQQLNDTVIAAKDAEIASLREAINITLEENGNLADGDNCTLIHLKQALEATNVD
jgi:hypothetical protein